MTKSYIIGNVPVTGSLVPRISTRLKLSDHLGAVMVRWGINRNHYMVDPGLYATGNPGPGSDVFVTANYKLSFDNLRKSLEGTDGWILVLDTRGVNVWCAAGKGTFSTGELVKRIRLSGLDRIVNHRRLILPQLSATGVAAHKVREQTGFNVHYGPVRAADIREFMAKGYRADKDMRKVKFGFADRIKLIPNDFIYGRYYLISAIVILLLVSGLSRSGFSLKNISSEGGPAILKVFLAYSAGIILTPVFLPYIPGRHFSLKGYISGTLIFLLIYLLSPADENIAETLSWFLIITVISSFMAMNFTGSSTYTSLSGVKKEMKLFVPIQIASAGAGLILQVIGKLII